MEQENLKEAHGLSLRNIPKEADQSFLNRIEQASRAELGHWSVDPGCAQRDLAAGELERRRNPLLRQAVVAQSKSAVVERMEPAFNPRTELSADAKYIARRIVTNLWIIFVLVPFITALVVYLLR